MSGRFGVAELRHLMRRLAAGDPEACAGLGPFAGLTGDELAGLLERVWGCRSDGATVGVDAARSLLGAARARERVLDVARRGGAVVFATAAPACLLGFHARLATLAREAGGRVVVDDGPHGVPVSGNGHRRIVWVAGVAVATDGRTLGGSVGRDAAAELLFHLARPDLVVGDGPFAAAAVRDGIETVVVADLDGMAFGVAAARGLPVTVVPVRLGACPGAYEELLDLAAAPSGRDGEDGDPAGR